MATHPFTQRWFFFSPKNIEIQIPIDEQEQTNKCISTHVGSNRLLSLVCPKTFRTQLVCRFECNEIHTSTRLTYFHSIHANGGGDRFTINITETGKRFKRMEALDGDAFGFQCFVPNNTCESTLKWGEWETFPWHSFFVKFRSKYSWKWRCGYICAAAWHIRHIYARLFHIKIGDSTQSAAHIHRCHSHTHTHTHINAEGRHKRRAENLYCYYFVAQYGIQPNYK